MSPEDVVRAALLHSPELARLIQKVTDTATWSGIVYHGTKSAFADFDMALSGASDPGLAGRAVYFAPSPEQASQFAENRHYGRATPGSGPQVWPALVWLENPFFIEDGQIPDGPTLTEIHPRGITAESGRAWRRVLRAAGHDGVIFKLGGDVVQVAVFDPSRIIPAMAPATSTRWQEAASALNASTRGRKPGR